MRNYDTLLARIACWLRPQGKLFVHIFAHRTLMYPFETAGADNWMGRHFFTGGLMPATDTLLWFQRDLQVEQHWQLDGTHYQRTANHWLQNQDQRRHEIMAVLRQFYGAAARPAVVSALAHVLDGLRRDLRLRPGAASGWLRTIG